MFVSTFDPCRCQLICFDQYFQGSNDLPEAYAIKLFHVIEVSTSFDGAFVHFCLLTCTFTSGAIVHDVCIPLSVYYIINILTIYSEVSGHGTTKVENLLKSDNILK